MATSPQTQVRWEWEVRFALLAWLQRWRLRSFKGAFLFSCFTFGFLTLLPYFEIRWLSFGAFQWNWIPHQICSQTIKSMFLMFVFTSKTTLPRPTLSTGWYQFSACFATHTLNFYCIRGTHSLPLNTLLASSLRSFFPPWSCSAAHGLSYLVVMSSRSVLFFVLFMVDTFKLIPTCRRR